ncbi:MAG: hypothetical protein H6831_08370 [Planctomycetes bacterium]|nr:hypothetical protein [Planctomycetota bacterium]MCB9904407.1 hypothetical protein [Planctomycetota bacterium]
MKRLLFVLACSSPFAASCASQGAREGATQGALYGALGAAVSSVVWGRDDVLGDAARGAVVGGTVGGVHGAANEANRKAAEDARNAQANDRARLEQENRELADRNRQLELEQRLMQEIGPDNTEAVRKLVNCDHQGAVLAARRAADSGDEHFRTAGVWLEAVCAYDRRDLSTARMFYPRLAELDPQTATAEDAELKVVQLVTTLEDTRQSFGLPRRCQ